MQWKDPVVQNEGKFQSDKWMSLSRACPDTRPDTCPNKCQDTPLLEGGGQYFNTFIQTCANKK